ncbi:MAG: tail fiber domain-containing protein [Agathobacter sp.]|nr:tail fiber domain-containing protein [Agathobacter sp.]
MRSKQDGARPRQAEDLLPLVLGVQKAQKNLEIGLTKTNTSVEDFVKAVAGDIKNLESQIDGVIGTYYYEGEPSLENIPASEWTTDEEKAEHINDWYYDKDTGYAYKFVQNEDGTYGWELAEDPRIAEALATANAAQETADGKMRVFTQTPTPPYDVGDLLILNEELYRCVNAKALGEEYAEGDFIIATKYTDDTLAKEVQKAVVTVIKNLDALTIRTQTLETNSLTADVANLKYAQIGEFNALTGRVNTLETTTTKTEELIFGAAGGTSIQTSFSNSVIAVLGDAQIKSAMIESLAVNKLLAGDISTSKHRIISDSGHMVLSDNTMTITDGTRVRVQIGKDASADYNMYVWDKSGNLMFDALGLTEKGVTRKIIRDDVVKDDADISASKLNIDSLFTVINEDGSNTLKSSKIFLDEKAQTLDVAFSALTTDVTDLETKQTSQGTQISTIQGQIASKIWKSDITTAVNALDTDLSGEITTLNTQYSTLDQTLSGLSTTVGSHSTQINSLGTRVATTETKYTQLDNKFSWVVKSGTSASDFTITDRMVKLTTESLVITDSTGTSTIISGGKMNINEIFAQDITATGTINGAILKGVAIEGADILLTEINEGDLDVANLRIVNKEDGYYADYHSFGITFYDAEDTETLIIQGRSGYIEASNIDTYKLVAEELRAATISAGEIISTNNGAALRMVNGNYGSFLYNNGAHVFLLLTNSGNQYGTNNALRPWYVNCATGAVTMGSGLSVTAGGFSISTNMTANASIVLSNNVGLYGNNASGTARILAYVGTDNYIYLGSGASTRLVVGSSTAAQRLQLKTSGRIDFEAGGQDTNGLCFSITYKTVSGGAKMATFRPTQTGASANQSTLGNSSYKFWTAYIVNGVVTGSDRRIKENVEDLDERYLSLIDLLVPKSYHLISDDKTTRRKHIGYIAQDVEEAMLKVGLTHSDCYFLHRDWVERENDYVGWEYSLSYDDIAVLVHAKVKRQDKVVEELKNRILVLEAQVLQLQLQQLGA